MRDLEKFRGIFCALNSIYDKNDEVDAEKTGKLALEFKKRGAKGVYVCGSTGEGFMLSTEERMKIAESVMKQVGSDFTVIVHVGAASTKESIILAKHAESIGVTAVSAVPSVYYRLNEKSVALHWNSIIDSTNLPFIIYNIPQLTGFNLTTDFLSEMAQNEKVVGVKNSAEPVYLMERYRKTVGDDFVIFNGSDEQFLGGRMMGADSGIGGTYGCMPELFVKLDSFIKNGDFENAKNIQMDINDIIFDLLKCESLYGASKQVMTLRYGIDCGQPRSPFLPVLSDDAKPIKEKIENTINKYK